MNNNLTVRQLSLSFIDIGENLLWPTKWMNKMLKFGQAPQMHVIAPAAWPTFWNFQDIVGGVTLHHVSHRHIPKDQVNT